MFRLLSAIFILVIFAHCHRAERAQELPSDPVETTQPDWMKSAVLYEVNLRQYTPEGTFSAFQKHLPRLKELGVDILWLMPIQPIGAEKRKGTLGSFYAVQDYYSINKEMGTEDEFRALIQSIHEADMHVIMDWQREATAWDHALTQSHPERYLRTADGNLTTPEHRPDMVLLDYDHEVLNEYMIQAMVYWVNEFDLDGYGCNLAQKEHPSFWKDVRKHLEALKPVILLADSPNQPAREGFDITGAWELQEAMQAISRGEANATKIHEFVESEIDSASRESIRMLYTTNHETNGKEGSVFERFGKAAEMYAVLTYALEGIPMIYSGQEVGLNRPLPLTEKDAISWGDHPFNALYSRLNKLKKDNVALWNGPWGGKVESLSTSNPDQIIAIYRVKDGNRVLAVFNCSPGEVTFAISSGQFHGDYKSFKSRSTVTLNEKDQLTLPAWGYEVYIAR